MHAFTDVAIYLAAALIAVPLFRRLGFGSVLGYLAAGALIGPWGLGLIGDVESVLRFSEIGVVFLLFVIGLELKPARLWVMRHAIFSAGSAQVGVTTLLLAGIALAFGLEPATAALIGFALALSSTAFVLQTLAEREELTAPHGRSAFGILLFQDLAVIPALALLPLASTLDVAGQGESLLWAGVQALGVMLALVVGGRYLLRPVFRAVARWGNEETFTIAALLVVIGSAQMMAWVDLSMGLGGFLAGVLLADSEYRHELEGNIAPFKGILLGLFFMSVGMAVDFQILGSHGLWLVLLAAGLIGVKLVALWLVARAMGIAATTALRLALVLAQGGEFAFVLFHAATGAQLLPKELADQLITVVILSMLATPALFALGEWLGRRAEANDPDLPYDEVPDEEPRVLIAGFGRVGQVVARVLQMRGLHYTALEHDADHVALVRRWGNKVYYGEPARLDTLRAAGAARAELLVVTVDDVATSIQLVDLARRHFPQLRIFARARDRHHALHLMELKVDFVIRETWLSSLAMAEALLQALGDKPEDARYAIEIFEEADRTMLERQIAHRDDLDQMIQTASDVRRELEVLLENDPRMSPLKRRAERPELRDDSGSGHQESR